jgi:hypothetical protein
MLETIRASFLPPAIATLLVAESPPASGKFFYSDDGPFRRYILAALGLADLESFRAAGFYLDDLCHEPVDKVAPQPRVRACRDGRVGLRTRIAGYRPRALVILLKRIEVDVREAAKGIDVPIYAVPFPGRYHIAKFRAAMAEIGPKLPRI